MSILNKIIKNTFYLFLSEILTKIISVIFIGYSARILGANAYGVFVLVSTMIVISSTFTNFGIRPMIIRKISKDRSNVEELISNILTMRLCLSIITYGALILFVNLNGYSQDIKLFVYIAGIAILFNPISDTFDTVFIAYERMKISGIFLVLPTFIFTTLSIIVLAYGYGLKYVFMVNVFVRAVFAFISGYFIWKRFFRFKPRINPILARDIAKESSLFFVVMLLNILNIKIDIIMISMMNGPIPSNLAIGYFAPAHNILFALMIFSQSLNKSMIPIVSQKIDTDPEFVRNSIVNATRFIMIAICFPVILATTFFSKEIVTLLFGSGYLMSAPALTILGWSYAFFALNIPANSILGSSRELKNFLPLLLGILLLNISLNYLLIPKYSYIGAAIATCVVMFLGFIGRFYFLRKIIQVRISELRGYLRLFFILGITIGSISLIRSYVLLPILIISTIVIYIFWLYIFKVFGKEEIDLVNQWVSRKAKVLT